MKTLFAAALVAALAGSAQASVRFSEIFLNPAGTDNGQEFIELRGTAGFSLNNLWILSIDGDSTSSGVVDQAINLSAFSLGTNGLFLWRDAASVIDADPAPGVQGPSVGTSVTSADFNPDLENGSNTFVIVSNFTGAVGTDLDANNDGIIDAALPWSSVIDAIALIENDGATNYGFAAALGGVNFGPNAGYNADLLALGADNVWYGGDTLGAAPGFYAFDPARNSGGFTGNDGATPGILNTIPTPGALALLGMGGLIAARRRRA
jgi:MYXO-CTERM domain-containing protein